ncbi:MULTISPECIES: extracellular solute-binding protein [unclassified Micromonospora]|uniref:extracellular solute-binding protein n=1 Tax=unclassified Micromonospora TaxID=2617518 RepID=UPI00340B3079
MHESADKITIKLWLNRWPMWQQLVDPVRRQAEEFNRRHPQYRAVVEAVNVGAFPREMARAAREGTAPHIASYQYTYLQEVQDLRDPEGRPFFTSVTEAVGGRDEILGEPVVLDDIVANMRAYHTFGGELRSMPRNTSTLLLYSNMDALRAAGITEPPATWSEVEAACAAVAGRNGARRGGITWPNFGWLFQQSVAQQGGLTADHDNGRSGRSEKVHYTSPEMLAYATWWRDLHRAGHYLYTGKSSDWWGCMETFAAGDTAMMISTSVEAGPIVRAARRAGFHVQASPMPYNERAGYSGSVIAGESLWLRDGLDERTRDGALALMQFLNSPRNARAVYDHGRAFVPSTEASIALLASEGWYDRNPHERAAVDQLRASPDSPATRGAVMGNFLPVQSTAVQAMHDVLVGGADLVARFSQANDQAQQLLDEYARRVDSGAANDGQAPQALPQSEPERLRLGA